MKNNWMHIDPFSDIHLHNNNVHIIPEAVTISNQQSGSIAS